MNIKLFILVIASLLIFGCTSQKKEITNILTQGCYWEILDVGSPHPVNMCYKFEKEGTCNYFYFSFYDKKHRLNLLSLYSDIGFIPLRTWKWIGDTLKVRHIEYLVIKYNEDSIFLRKAIRKTDTTILIKNCSAYYNPDIPYREQYDKAVDSFLKKNPIYKKRDSIYKRRRKRRDSIDKISPKKELTPIFL